MIVKRYPFRRSLIVNFCMPADRDEERFAFLEGFLMLVCLLNERRTMAKVTRRGQKL